MARPVPGEYATIIKEGKFGAYTVQPGDRAKVISLTKHYSTKNKKVWALVDLVGAAGNSYGRINIPLWWLIPRSVLDDLAEA